MDRTKIDWCDSTWNPVTGCLHGCEYCYARRIAERFGTLNKGDVLPDTPETSLELDEPVRNGSGKIEPYPANFLPTLHRYRLDEPARKRRPRNIFVGSMADVFGDWVPDSWIGEVFAACRRAPQHNYLFLTKNPKRYIDLELEGKMPHGDNFWFGTSVTRLSDGYAWFEEKGSHWFLSVEPMLENLGAMNPAAKPEWVIIGAETGKRKNKVVPERAWIERLVGECRLYGIPVFMKSSLENIWGAPLVQEFPEQLKRA